MLIEQVKQLPVMDRLLYWIQERESIRLLKESGKPKPWTDDEILRSYRFCNVRRMDDKVSRWLLENWYQPHYNEPNVLLACILARFFNKIDTFKAIGFPKQWRPEKIKSTARGLDRPFGPAYVISPSAGNGLGCEDKISIVVDVVCMSVIKGGPAPIDSMKRCVEWLCGFLGIGSFMAGQIAADFRWATSGNWVDVKSWAAKGPGSQRGMNRLREQPLNKKIQQPVFVELLDELMVEIRDALPQISKRLEAIDFQNCLCEFDKYERVLWGEGRPKQKYKGV